MRNHFMTQTAIFLALKLLKTLGVHRSHHIPYILMRPCDILYFKCCVKTLNLFNSTNPSKSGCLRAYECVDDCLHCALSFTFHKLSLPSWYANCAASSLTQLRVTCHFFNYSTYDAKYVSYVTRSNTETQGHILIGCSTALILSYFQ